MTTDVITRLVGRFRKQQKLLRAAAIGETFTPEQAKEQFDLDISPGWQVKIEDFNPVTQIASFTFVTPTGWQIKPDDTFISPEGELVTRAQIEQARAAQVAVTPPIEPLPPPPPLPPLEPLPLPPEPIEFEEPTFREGFEADPEGFIRTLFEQSSAEVVAQALRSFDIDEATITDVTTQLTGEGLIRTVFDMDVETFQFMIEEHTDDFLTRIREGGRTPEKVSLLTDIVGIPLESDTETDVDDIFPPVFPRALTAETRMLESQWGKDLVRTVATAIDKDYLVVTNADIESYIIAHPEIHEEVEKRQQEFPPLNLGEEIVVLGRSLLKVPQLLVASVLQMMNPDSASVVDRTKVNRTIDLITTDQEAFVREIEQQFSLRPSILGITATDLAELGPNLAFSITSMVAGAVVGVPIALQPIPGSRIMAWTMGTAASGAAAFNMSRYQIVQEYLEFKNEEMIRSRGTGITLEEENQLKADFDNKAREHAMWEALPEAISNLAFAKILTAPLKAMVGRPAAVRIITKLGALYGEEFLTETITQKFQSDIEVAVGLREKRITWLEALREIAPQTFLLTTILGGMGQTGISAVNRLRRSLKSEIGIDHVLYQELRQKLGSIKGLISEFLEDERGALEGMPEKPGDLAPIPDNPDAVGAEIAQETGLRYDGVQEGIGMQFTDKEVTNTTFYANTLEEAQTKLAEKRDLFAKAVTPEAVPILPEVRLPEGQFAFRGLNFREIEGGIGIQVQNPETQEWVNTAVLNRRVLLADYMEVPDIGLWSEERASLGSLVFPSKLPKPPVVEVPKIPKAEIGEPEAGLQPDLFGAPPIEVRPKTRGEIVQISMDDQLKLEQARREVAEIPELTDEQTEAYEAWGEAEGLKANLELDPVATYRFKMGGRNVGLDALISIREQAFPETFTVKQAQALNPEKAYERYTQKGTKEFNRVPRDAVLDQLTKEFNMTPDEIANRVEAIRREKARIKQLDAKVVSDMTEKSITPRTELTTEQVTENWEAVGQPKMTLKEARALSGFFGEYVMSENVLKAYELNRALQSQERSRRFQRAKARVQELAVREGISYEEAFKKASAELSGELPVIKTDYMEGITQEMRDAMFSLVYHAFDKLGPQYQGEMWSTITALTNALTGKPIPNIPGKGSILFPEGGSAWLRLNYVFGKQPRVMKSLEKMGKEKKSLEEIIDTLGEIVYKDPVPVDVEYLRTLSGIPFGYRTMMEPDFENPVVRDPRNPADLQFAKSELDLAQRFAKGELTFDEFQLERLNARDAAYPSPLVTPFGKPIDNAFKQAPLMTFAEKQVIVRILKELGLTVTDIGGFLRANMASFDMSFWRQQKTLIAGHPVAFYRANVEAFKALFSQKSADASYQLILNDPLYHLYDQIDIDFLRPLTLPKGTARWRGVEEFGYITGDRPLPRMVAKIPWIKLSSRAFVTGTNAHNWMIFKTLHKATLRRSEKIASGDITLAEGEAFDITQEMTDYAKMLGDFTQRAQLGKLSGLAPILGNLFFAPRSKLGRLLTPRHLLSGNPRVRAEAWKDLTLMVTAFGGLVMVGYFLGLWDVDTDPRSGEFMSIRIGNLRIDPWGGLRQFVVLYARLITGTGISSVTGTEYEANPIAAGNSFFRSSLSPLASIILDFWTGRNFLGDEVDITDKKQWLERLAPFSVQSVWEAFEEDWKLGVIALLPAWYGEGVSTYTGEWVENFKKLGLLKYPENGEGPVYDVKDFYSDHSGQFTGVDPATLTAKKGFPEYIRVLAEVKVIKSQLSDMPNEVLATINADPVKGLTFKDYYEMWGERQKLVDAGDEAEYTTSELQPDETYKKTLHKGEDAVKAWDADERHNDAQLGNFSQTQYAFLADYHSFDNKILQARFLEKFKSQIGINPRLEWLRTNSEANAKMAVYGQATVYSKEAYDKARALGKELDFPDSALVEYLPPEHIVDTHFNYQDKGQEFGYSSLEVELLLLKDHLDTEKIEEQSYVTWRNTTADKLTVTTKPLEYLQLRVDNTQNYDDLEAAQEADDEEEITAIRARAVGDETFRDIERRVTVMGKGTRETPIDPELVNAYVERLQMIDLEGVGASSAEVMLQRVDNVAFNDFMMDENIWGDKALKEIDREKIPTWRINVEWATQDGEYDALETTEERKDYLFPDGQATPYALARYTRQSYEKDIPEGHRSDYVAWYTDLSITEKPDEYPANTPYWEDDWWMLEHKQFHDEVWMGILENQSYPMGLQTNEKGIQFLVDAEGKISQTPPNRDIGEKYLEYIRISRGDVKYTSPLTELTYESEGQGADQYRIDNIDLDEWGVAVAIWTTSMTERRKQLGLTPGEIAERELLEGLERFRRYQDYLRQGGTLSLTDWVATQ